MFSLPRCALGALGALVAIAPLSIAQTNDSSPLHAEIRVQDGSSLRMVLLEKSLDVKTKFGLLSIPLAEIRAIEFGLHIPSNLVQPIQDNIEQLGAHLYREREEAAKYLLAHGFFAYPKLRQALTHADGEVARRSGTLIRQIAKKFPQELLSRSETDVLHTIHFKVVGTILNESLKAQSPLMGEKELPLCDMVGLEMRGYRTPNAILVDAARYGSNSNQWLNTGVAVDSQLQLVITSAGHVDLYPIEPGQYTSKASGMGAMGRDNQFPAGALVGRVGESGTPFLIGENYHGMPGEKGKLYLHIVPSPWQNGAAGMYRVDIRTEQILMTTRK